MCESDARTARPPERPGRVLLVGYGKLGARLAERLTRDGDEVYAMRRDVTGLPRHLHAVRADVTRPLAAPLPSVDAMVVTLPPSVEPDGYRAVLERIHDALGEAPARTVFVSSTRVFEGWDGPQPITELDVPRPVSARAKVIREGEIVAAAMFGALIVRPAGIYGPGRENLVRTVKEQRPINSLKQTNRIHETDLVRALHALLRHDDPPSVLHAVDQGPATLGEVTRYIGELLGVAAPPDSDAPGRLGNTFDGAALLRVLRYLEYPGYRDGYRAVLGDTSGRESPDLDV